MVELTSVEFRKFMIRQQQKGIVVLLSMTGFGCSKGQNERLNVAVEVRAVNNRYLKVNSKFPDAYAALEGEIERVVREHIARGSVTVVLDVRTVAGSAALRFNSDVLGDYWQQIKDLSRQLSVAPPADFSSLVSLPGVVAEQGQEALDSDVDWPFLREILNQALRKLHEFREREGHSMRDDLLQNGRVIATQLEEVSRGAPEVVRAYRDKLLERMRELLKGSNATINDSDLIREVSLFADRCDINEEITRLRCHLEQYEVFLNDSASQGRKLDFLGQEMFREVNTIGSKANNVSLAKCVVEMKSAVERIREVLQNVE
jgi:uncharacterized protein (TIGR00255 family)